MSGLQKISKELGFRNRKIFLLIQIEKEFLKRQTFLFILTYSIIYGIVDDPLILTQGILGLFFIESSWL